METLKLWTKWFLMIGGMIFWFFVAVGIFVDKHEPERVDCTVAEFHPDYPAEIKEACRRMRHVIDT